MFGKFMKPVVPTVPKSEHEALKRQHTSLTEHVTRLEREKATLQADYTTLEGEIETLQARQHALDETNARLKETVAQLSERNTALRGLATDTLALLEDIPLGAKKWILRRGTLLDEAKKLNIVPSWGQEAKEEE